MSGTLKLGDIIAYGALHKYFREHVLGREHLTGSWKREDNISRGKEEKYGRKVWTSFGYERFGQNGVHSCSSPMYEFPTGVVAGSSGSRRTINNVEFLRNNGWGRKTANELWYLWSRWNDSGHPFRPTGYHAPKGWRVDKCNSNPSSHRLNIKITDDRRTFRFQPLPVGDSSYNDAEVASDEPSTAEFSRRVLADSVYTGPINSSTDIELKNYYSVGTTVAEQVVNKKNTDTYALKTETDDTNYKFTQSVEYKAGANVGPVKNEAKVSAQFEQQRNNSQSKQTGTIKSVGFSESKSYEVTKEETREITIKIQGDKATPSDSGLASGNLIQGECYKIALYRRYDRTTMPVYSTFRMSGGTTSVVDTVWKNRPLMKEVPTMEIIQHAKNHWADSNLITNTKDLKPYYDNFGNLGFEYSGKTVLSNDINYGNEIVYYLDTTCQPLNKRGDNSSSKEESRSMRKSELSNNLDFREKYDFSDSEGRASGLSIDLMAYNKNDYYNEGVFGSGGKDLVNLAPSKKPIIFDSFESSYFEGSEGADNIKLGSNTLNNSISTNDGRDKVRVSTDQETIFLGDGDDILKIDSGNQSSIILGRGSDTVVLNDGNLSFIVNDFNPIFDSFKISDSLRKRGLTTSLKVSPGDEKHLVDSYVEFKLDDKIIGEARFDLSDVSLSNLFDKGYLKQFALLSSKYRKLDLGETLGYGTKAQVDSWDLFEKVFVDQELLFKPKVSPDDWTQISMKEKRKLLRNAMRDIQLEELEVSSKEDMSIINEQIDATKKGDYNVIHGSTTKRELNQFIKVHDIEDPDSFVDGFGALTTNAYIELG